jgi:hypothetical protein
MRTKFILLILLLTSFVIFDTFAQEMPLVYMVENTGAKYPKPPLPTIDKLPFVKNLPDPFQWSDGRGRLLSVNDWFARRSEIKAEIENYEIGLKPDRPDTISASYSSGVLTVNMTVNGYSFTLTSQVSLPAGNGPFPAVIGMGGGSGSLPVDIFSSRNIARISFNYNDVTTDQGASNTDPYYQLYPHLNIDNTGQYSAWAWGVSRIIDGLELVQDELPIDLKRIAVTGCSRGGKMALFAGAFDERIALTIAQESGGGGAAAWRFSQTLPGVENLGATDHGWFRESMFQFSGNNVSRLPHDHHELMAMVAPRALLVLGNPDYQWLADESGYVSCMAAKEVWNALGVPDRFGFSIVGGHLHCNLPDVQRPEVTAFIDKFMLGDNNANTNIATHSYSTNLSPWITWTTPILSNNPSNLSWTSLVYPSNFQKDLDNSVTLKWNKADNVEKYYIQLSTDVSFGTIDKSDSTTTDTAKTFTGLLDGITYYWRVKVKNNSGFIGPWSDVWSFTTYIPLPSTPQIVGAVSVKNRIDYVTFTWKKADNARQYIIQLSHSETFTSIFKSDSTTTDTTKTISGLSEGRKEYWRVKAKNVTGSSSWNESGFSVSLKAPTDLVLQSNVSNEITLNWKDNSAKEDGYVIERMQGAQTTFTFLDSLKQKVNTYVDKSIEQSGSYTYRIKAYNAVSESDYSNEASLSIVGIDEEMTIPADYSINQNYPNPFNPSTKIKFALPHNSLTKLVVYDLLGRELQTLINKELEAGYHEIIFDASIFPSGIYFYRIQSGKFVQTKKMILMK